MVGHAVAAHRGSGAGHMAWLTWLLMWIFVYRAADQTQQTHAWQKTANQEFTVVIAFWVSDVGATCADALRHMLI